jgi:hypothetical protein
MAIFDRVLVGSTREMEMLGFSRYAYLKGFP